MIWIAFALAAAPTPAKLVILTLQQPTTVVSYSSLARCEKAKTELLRQSYNPKAGTSERTPEGGVIFYGPQRVTAYCIPG